MSYRISQLMLWTASIRFYVLHDPGNMSIAVEISLLTCIRVEIYLFPIYFRLMAAISDFKHTLTSDSIPTCLSVLLDPENMVIAIGISLLSWIQAEKYVFEVYRSPSWIFHFRLLLVWLYNIATIFAAISQPLEVKENAVVTFLRHGRATRWWS